ncbi:MAG: hypothetical protein Q9M75_03920 [Ghiorsea sp.]|nr:hypothetical protein [Ghiorsea sp.]
MRVFVLTAFFALQLSVFTCGFNIHVHTADAAPTQVAQQADVATYNTNLDTNHDHACHVHTSHTFIEFDVTYTNEVPLLSLVQHHDLLEPSLKKIPFSIDYPPKTTV